MELDGGGNWILKTWADAPFRSLSLTVWLSQAETAFDFMANDRLVTQTVRFTEPGRRVTIEPLTASLEGRPESCSSSGFHWGEGVPECFDNSLVGRRIRVFWATRKTWLDALVARFVARVLLCASLWCSRGFRK